MSRNLIEMLRAREGEAPATALTVLKEAMDERMLVCDGGAPVEIEATKLDGEPPLGAGAAGAGCTSRRRPGPPQLAGPAPRRPLEARPVIVDQERRS